MESEVKIIETEKLLFTKRDAARMLSFAEPTISKYMKDDLINYIKIGKGVVRFTRKQIDDFIEYLSKKPHKSHQHPTGNKTNHSRKKKPSAKKSA